MTTPETRYLARYVGTEPTIVADRAWIRGTERLVSEQVARQLAAHGYFRVVRFVPPTGCG